MNFITNYFNSVWQGPVYQEETGSPWPIRRLWPSGHGWPFSPPRTRPPHPNTDKASSGLLCLPGVLPEVHMSSALREKLPFVKRGDTNRSFQNSHVFLVPHLVSLSTRSCQFRAPFSWSKWSNLCTTWCPCASTCSVYPYRELLNSRVQAEAKPQINKKRKGSFGFPCNVSII